MKGQTFTPDFMASMLVFALILSVFLASWNLVLSSQSQDVSQSTAMLQASNTATLMISTPGYPNNWEEDSVDVEIVGFAEPDHVLDEEKLKAFREKDYTEQRELLQAGNFYMTVENETGIISLDGAPLEFGNDYSSASTVIPNTRSVQLNKSGKIQEAELNYVVWN
jgi:hypothetical protein